MIGARCGRRRALAVIAAAAGAPFLASGAGARRVPVFEWRGRALGAEARLLLAHPEPAAARRIIIRCLDEITRLERIFSLHLPDSEIATLNRTGRLDATSHDLRNLLGEAHRVSAQSGGAFDVTVQPLWQLYAAHFAAQPRDTAGPPAHAIEATRRRVGYRAIAIDGTRVRFLRPAMAVTLNGIAQGYISDRVADLLRAAGFARVLVQLGETVAGAPASDGRPWRVGIPDPFTPDRVIETCDVIDVAIATSSGFATRFDTAGRHHHLFDPTTGRSAHRSASVTVLAPRATTADALSTALAVMPPATAIPLLRAADGAAFQVAFDRSRRWLGT